MKYVFLLYSITILTLSACISSKNLSTSSSTKKDISGLYAEYWLENVKNNEISNVNYVDTVKITYKSSDKILVSCTNREDYKYDLISYDGKVLKFRMDNTNHNNDHFYIYYTMQVDPSASKLKGEITNIDNDKVYVDLELINP
jgi:hypothetical protein